MDYNHFKGTFPKLDWCRLVWQQFIPPSRSFIYWRWVHEKLLTDDNLQKRGCNLASICCLCRNYTECSFHLFLYCAFSMKLWNWISSGTNQQLNLSCWSSLLQSSQDGSALCNQVLLAVVLHTCGCFGLRETLGCSKGSITLLNVFFTGLSLKFG